VERVALPALAGVSAMFGKFRYTNEQLPEAIRERYPADSLFKIIRCYATTPYRDGFDPLFVQVITSSACGLLASSEWYCREHDAPIHSRAWRIVHESEYHIIC